MKITTTIYKCDRCKKELGDTYLSISFNNYSGWVRKAENWEHNNPVLGTKHFCNFECLTDYFDDLDIINL